MTLGNPRQPSEAQHEYYLVLASLAKNLRYPPQYADLRFDDETEAQLGRYTLRLRGLKYWIVDRDGNRIKTWKVR